MIVIFPHFMMNTGALETINTYEMCKIKNLTLQMFFQSQWLKTSENPKILQFLSTFNFLLSDMNK